MVEPQAAVPFPSAAGSTLQRFVQEAFDFALVVDATGRVTAVVHGTSSPDPGSLTCVGRALADSVSVESRHKVGELLGSNCLSGDGEYRWRHINLLTVGDGSLPVLAKYVEFGEGAAMLRLIIVRDLTPISQMQQQFVAAYAEMDRLVARLSREGVPSELADADLDTRVGMQPLDTIIGETVRYLEKRCIALALSRSRGDHRAAALLLGLSLEDFSDRYEAVSRG